MQVAVSAPTADDSNDRTGSGWKPRYVAWIVILILVTEFQFIIYAFPANAIVQIGASFKTDQTIWIQVAFALASAVAAPLFGRLADIGGKRRVIVIMLGMGVVGALISTFAPNFGVMIAGRVVQGVTLGLAFVCASLVRDIFPQRILPLAISLSVTGSGLLSILTSLAAGQIIAKLGWQGIFWIPAILAAIIIVLVLAIVPESPLRQRARSLDWAGGILFGIGIAGVLLAVSLAPSWGWGSPLTLGFIGAGVVLLVIWGFQSSRVAEPLVPVRELRHLPLLVGVALTFLGVSSVSFFFALVPRILLTPPSAHLGYGLGLQISDISTYSSLFSIGSFVSGFAAGLALSRFPAPFAVIGAGATMGIGFVVAGFGLSNPGLFLVATVIIGLCSGSVYAAAFNVAALAVRPERQASAASIVTVGANVGTAVLQVVIYAYLNANAAAVAGGQPIYTAGAIRVSLLVPVALAIVLVTLGIALRVYQRRRGGLSEISQATAATEAVEHTVAAEASPVSAPKPSPVG